jgi:hypothetical protein
MPPIAEDPVDCGQLEQRSPPLGASLGVTHENLSVSHVAEKMG